MNTRAQGTAVASHVPHVCTFLQSVFCGESMHVGEGTEDASLPALSELKILGKQQSPQKQDGAVRKERAWETQAYRSSGKSFALSEPQFPLCDWRVGSSNSERPSWP